MGRNLRKIPQDFIEKINAFDVDDVVVACAKRLRPEDIGKYVHLGMKLKGQDLVLPDPQMPPPKSGRYSKANVEGREVVRRDLPMMQKTFYWESPNWGDWSRGYHTHSRERDVYQREFYPPKHLTISMILINKIDSPSQYVVKFAIDEVLNRRAKGFESDLFYNLNMLQETIGDADVYQSNATLEEYEGTVKVDWEILPPGKVEDFIRHLLKGKTISDSEQKQVEDRVRVMERFKPKNYIAGKSGFARYFGAKFKDNLVVFENLHYGNALYIMFENWVKLSQRSRTELLKGFDKDFRRVLHTKGWEVTLEGILAEHGVKPENHQQ